MQLQDALISLILFIIVLNYAGLFCWWASYKILKMGISVLKNGYIPVGSGLHGYPKENTPTNKAEGYFLVFCALCGAIVAAACMFGWIPMLKFMIK